MSLTGQALKKENLTEIEVSKWTETPADYSLLATFHPTAWPLTLLLISHSLDSQQSLWWHRRPMWPV